MVKTGASGPSLTLYPRAAVSPYLGGPIAVNQDWEGVVGKVSRSHVAHLELEHDLIWGSESTDTSTSGPEAKLKSWLLLGHVPGHQHHQHLFEPRVSLSVKWG